MKFKQLSSPSISDEIYSRETNNKKSKSKSKSKYSGKGAYEDTRTFNYQSSLDENFFDTPDLRPASPIAKPSPRRNVNKPKFNRKEVDTERNYIPISDALKRINHGENTFCRVVENFGRMNINGNQQQQNFQNRNDDTQYGGPILNMSPLNSSQDTKSPMYRNNYIEFNNSPNNFSPYNSQSDNNNSQSPINFSDSDPDIKKISSSMKKIDLSNGHNHCKPTDDGIDPRFDCFFCYFYMYAGEVPDSEIVIKNFLEQIRSNYLNCRKDRDTFFNMTHAYYIDFIYNPAIESGCKVPFMSRDDIARHFIIHLRKKSCCSK